MSSSLQVRATPTRGAFFEPFMQDGMNGGMNGGINAGMNRGRPVPRPTAFRRGVSRFQQSWSGDSNRSHPAGPTSATSDQKLETGPRGASDPPRALSPNDRWFMRGIQPETPANVPQRNPGEILNFARSRLEAHWGGLGPVLGKKSESTAMRRKGQYLKKVSFREPG